MIWLPAPVNVALAIAVETFAALVVYGGGGPPLPCPAVGIVQVAMVVGVVHDDGGEGWELTVRVSDPELPVSVVPRNRFPVVLLYMPFVEEVTLTAIVHVPFPATVMFVKESEVAPTVSEAGDGTPHPVYVIVVLEIVTFAGRLSVKLTLDIELAPGLLTVNVSVDVPPGLMVFGENDFVRLALIIIA
jgi:hypothetical protein